MNIMKLPQFLNMVDKQTKAMSHDELEQFIHEIARKLPEKQREDFIDLISQIGSQKDTNSSTIPKDNGEENVKKQILDILPVLEIINRGEICLDSEYNEEWDDWYNSDAEEILFSDPEGLLSDIEEAIALVHKCLDMELYEDGCKLCEAVSYLDIYVDGDYNDYDCNPLGIEDLFKKNLIFGEFEKFIKEALYLTYVGTPLSYRADELYFLFDYFDGSRVNLENIRKRLIDSTLLLQNQPCYSFVGA